jgi:hypothetical protein
MALGIRILTLATDALMEHPWFHGSIPRELSDALLAGYVAVSQICLFTHRRIASPKAPTLCAQAAVVPKIRSLSLSGDDKVDE